MLNRDDGGGRRAARVRDPISRQSVGLLASNRDASNFLPKHFSRAADEFLELRHGASLGPETPLSFESHLARAPVVLLLRVASVKRRAHTRALRLFARLRVMARSPASLGLRAIRRSTGGRPALDA